MDQEYSAIDGNPSFRQRALRVAWGDDCAAMNEGRMVSAQTLSGTGSLRVGFEFLKEWYPKKDAKIFVPDPHLADAQRHRCQIWLRSRTLPLL